MKTLDEQQRINLIIESINYVKRVKAMGMPASSYSKALREPIYFLWESYGKGTKYENAKYRSKNSKLSTKAGAGLVRDHAIPFKFVQEALLCLTDITPENVKIILNDMLHACILTKDEDQLLTKMGLKSAMPPGSELKDVFARYQAAGIEVEENLRSKT